MLDNFQCKHYMTRRVNKMGLQLQLNKEADIEPSNIQFWIYFHNDFFQFSPCTTVRFFEQDGFTIY